MDHILLQGGVVLLHDSHDNVHPHRADVLIQGNSIVQIGPSIPPSADFNVINCADKIICPGFVDTHQHMWETSLKGVCEDLTAIDYFATMFTAGLSMSPQHIFWGTLAGCMEAINSGTTTALDFAHVNWTGRHSEQALAATATSGIRSVFAHAATVTVTSIEPNIELGECLPDRFVKELESFCRSSTISSANSRIQVGLGFDFYHLPKDSVIGLFRIAQELGVRVFTSHWGRFKGDKNPGLPALLHSYNLLDKGFVFSHMGAATKDDLSLLQAQNAFISSSPSTEMTLGLGPPLCFNADLEHLDVICSIGTDCNCCSSASVVNELRIGLLTARGNHAARHIEQGALPPKVCRTSQDAFNLGTIQGARALSMEKEIGSIAVGKKADVVIFDMLTPNMAVASQHDPVKAIILHSGPGDIDTVIVDGEIRKQDKQLLPVQLLDWDRTLNDLRPASHMLEFADVLPRVMNAQDAFLAKLRSVDLKKLGEIVSQLYGM